MTSKNKTQEEREKEDEQAKLMHVLSLPEADKHNICLTKCNDIICSKGCLQQKAHIFRPQIMQGIKYCRERDWYKYPLYANGFEDTVLICQNGSEIICRDPVCQVAGCLQKPAWHYRHLIRIALREEKNQ